MAEPAQEGFTVHPAARVSNPQGPGRCAVHKIVHHPHSWPDEHGWDVGTSGIERAHDRDCFASLGACDFADLAASFGGTNFPGLVHAANCGFVRVPDVVSQIVAMGLDAIEYARRR